MAKLTELGFAVTPPRDPALETAVVWRLRFGENKTGYNYRTDQLGRSLQAQAPNGLTASEKTGWEDYDDVMDLDMEQQNRHYPAEEPDTRTDQKARAQDKTPVTAREHARNGGGGPDAMLR
eukprot:6469087-Amphidinium_carterae.7